MDAATQAARELGGPITLDRGAVGSMCRSASERAHRRAVCEFAFALIGAVIGRRGVDLVADAVLAAAQSSQRGGWRRGRAVHRSAVSPAARPYNDGCGSLNTLPVTCSPPSYLQHLFLFASAVPPELAPTEDQGVVTQSVAAPNATLQQRQCIRARSTDLRRAPGNRASSSSTPGQSTPAWDETLGPARCDQYAAADHPAGGRQGRRRADRRVPPRRRCRAVLACHQPRPRHHGAVRPQHRGAAILQQSLASGMFIFPDCDLKIDNPQST